MRQWWASVTSATYLLIMRLSPIISTLIDIGMPSSVVDTPAAMWAGGQQRWYSALGRWQSQSAMSTRSIGALMMWQKADSASIGSDMVCPFA